MGLDVLNNWILATGLLSLRISPLFAFAPPFALMRVPVIIRVALGLSIAASLAAGSDLSSFSATIDIAGLIPMAFRELLIGIFFVVMFQAAFAGLYVAGRVVDVQAGFGLSLLIDPTSRAQMPLVGTLFAYAAGALFFGVGGLQDVLRLWAASIEAMPLGGTAVSIDPGRVISFFGAATLIGFGAASSSILALFLADMAIAFLTRTIPQMNVLVFGLQVKTIVLLLVLSASFGIISAIIARLFRTMLQTIAALV
jgi:flagellar biosynthesis protein FliR